MSQRRELQRRSDSLADIRDLLGAMKNMAQVESRRLAEFIEAQSAATAIVAAAWADFALDQAAQWSVDPPPSELLCVIGSERGFCGDLNQHLAAQAETVAAGTQVVLVGSRLAGAWEGLAAARLPGAGFADEVQKVLLELLAALVPLLRSSAHGAVGLSLLYLNDHGLQRRRLLPAPTSTPATRRSHPVRLQLPPQQYLEALLRQWLETALGSALYEALLHENQRRLQHMEQARQRVDERLDELARMGNRARQEEITQEIEVILLSADLQEEPLNPDRPHRQRPRAA